MMIFLTPEQQAWLDTRVARGDYKSTDDAVRQFIDERIAEETDDLAWAKPHVDEALEQVARGEFLTLEEHRSRNAARFAAFKDQ
jgi:antitoxin ParD1/3/4